MVLREVVKLPFLDVFKKFLVHGLTLTWFNGKILVEEGKPN